MTDKGDLFMEKPTRNQTNLLAKECMVTALMQLLEKKPFSAITVSELTRKAGVSRMTYYRNYSSKEDIFSSFLNDILYDYHSESLQLPIKGCFYDMHNLIHCFTYFEKYKGFIRTLFQNGMGHMLLTSLSDYVIRKWYKDTDPITYYYTLQAFSGSLFNLYIAWALADGNETPKEMAEIIYGIYRLT